MFTFLLITSKTLWGNENEQKKGEFRSSFIKDQFLIPRYKKIISKFQAQSKFEMKTRVLVPSLP